MPVLKPVHSKVIPVGWQCPEFELKDGRKKLTLKKLTWAEGLVVLFINNHCYTAQAVWPIISKLAYTHRLELAFLAVNPDNDREYPMESPQETKTRRKELKLTFPYVSDSDQKMAKAFQVQCFPEVFVFRHVSPEVFRLFYHGSVLAPEFERSLERLVQKLDPVLRQPTAVGCPIHWKD